MVMKLIVHLLKTDIILSFILWAAVSFDVSHHNKEGDQQGEDIEKTNGVTTEPKIAKKKKKKDKASKEVKESEDHPNNVNAAIGPEETERAGQVEDASTVDVKERLKRAASAKKKKSKKETAA
ncbi:hypothetical protein HAX54_041354 [Datura stramonium]|uniref:Uncharacterized protein n=1 Tax=Datura stramonium TaxID=4076 RepID=A0ABS8VSY1_DATST|nr:hypothetical protein [Datura stramonium]